MPDRPRIVSVGELLVEFIPLRLGQRLAEPGAVEKVASGAAGIYACAAARLGAEVAMVAVVGQEAFSDFALEALGRDGVDCRHVRRVADRQIGLSFVEYVGTGRRFLYYRRDSAGSTLGPADIPTDLVQTADVVHFPGNLLFSSESLRAACRRTAELAAASGRAALSVDPNVRLEMVQDPKDLDRLREVIARARIVKPSEIEAELLTGRSDPLAACRQLTALGPELVAVSLGAQGCLLSRGGRCVHCEPYRVQCQDPTGAGDAFSAGLALGWASDWPLERIARFASAAGALTTTAVGHIGKAIPTREEVERLMASQNVRCEPV